MPSAPPKRKPTAEQEAARHRAIDRARIRPGGEWYKTARWQRRRAEFLSRPENMFCYNPLGLHEPGKGAFAGQPSNVLSNCVDHKTPHKGNEGLFWDESNWAGCCLTCNSVKAARLEGGFGNARRV